MDGYQQRNPGSLTKLPPCVKQNPLHNCHHLGRSTRARAPPQQFNTSQKEWENLRDVFGLLSMLKGLLGTIAKLHRGSAFHRDAEHQALCYDRYSRWMMVASSSRHSLHSIPAVVSNDWYYSTTQSVGNTSLTDGMDECILVQRVWDSFYIGTKGNSPLPAPKYWSGLFN